MKNNYKLKALLSSTLMCIMMVFAFNVNAQVSAYSFAQTSGTYTPITGGTAQWSITSVTRPDDNSTAALPLGFTFVYGGVNYTTVGVNNNGMLVLGGAGATDYNGLNGTINNIVTPLGDDLAAGYRINATRTTGSNVLTAAINTTAIDIGDVVYGTGIPAGTTVVSTTVNTVTLSANATSSSTTGTFVFSGGGVRTEVLGVTPNQIFVAQWTDMSSFGTNNQSLDFQVRLYEGTNVVEIVYGECYYTGTTSDDATIGLRGASAADFNNRNAATDINTSIAGTTIADLCFYNSTAFVAPMNGLTFTWSPPSGCVGTPSAGVTAGPASACSSVNFLLSLTGATTGASGLAYQWQSSPDGLLYTNIAATGATATVSQVATTYYQCIVTCTPSGMADTSVSLMVTMNAPAACYCTVTFPSAVEPITLVNIGTINNVTSPTVGGTPALQDFTALSTSLSQGTSSTITIKGNTDGNFTTLLMTYVDWNQDGDFVDPGESYNCGSIVNSTGVDAIQTTGTISVPMTATLGNTRMRVIKKFSTSPGPCETLGFGQAEDYTIIVTLPPPCPAPTALTATGITTTTANLGWTCTACTGTFALEWGPTGFTPGTGTIVNPATSTVPVSGLTASTTYQFYVIQDCSVAGDGFSLLSGPFSFTTLMLGDNVCDALPLAFGTNGPYNTTGTTVQTGEPAPAGGVCNSQAAWCNNVLERTLWFSFVAPASGRVSITSPGFDTQLALWSAANCGAILTGGATLVAANDDGGPSFSSVLNPVNCLTPGTTYFVQLDGFNGAVGSTTIVLTDLGVADPSFTGLAAAYCDNAAVATLTPAVTGGVFAGTGIAGSTFDPTTAGAGTYSVTYTLNGCYTSTQSVTVNAAPVATSVITSPVLCNAGNATVTVSATGGTPSYTGTGAFTAPAGAYSYTVTDVNSCSSTTTGTITEPTAVAVTPSSTAILCNGGTSTVTINATGGTGALTGTGTFTQSAGTTVYTVTDANSCVGTASVVITEPSAIVITPSSSAVLCNGDASTVTIIASGGTPSYTGQGTFSQLAGTTVYTVTDANACSATASVVVTEPTAVVATNSSTSILCNAGTATVTVVATGGTPSYTGTGAFTQSAGTVVYTVMDANGCSTTTSATLTEPTAVVVSYSETGVLCNGGTSAVTVSATGGTPSYTGTGTFTQSAGTTNYIVADANGCSTSTNITVTEPTAMAATSSSTAILCNGGTATVTVVATGGTTPYTGDGSFTQSAGTTVYTVTDANGCITTASQTITEPTAVMVMFTSTPILCNGGTSSVVITGMDGTPAYTGEGTFTQSAGTTVYTVIDANSCVGTASVVVTQPAAIATAQTVNFCGSGSVTVGTSTYTAAGTYTDILAAANTCDSTVTTTVTITTVDATTSVAGAAITANSTTGTYLWLDCNAAYAALTPSETNQVYNSTANGSYAVQVTDNGCVDTSACVVISTTGIENNGANVLSVYPNPTMGMFNIAIANANIAELVITIVDIQGKEVFSSVDKNVNGTYNKQINLEEISKGLYYIKMNTGSEVKIQKLIVQ